MREAREGEGRERIRMGKTRGREEEVGLEKMRE